MVVAGVAGTAEVLGGAGVAVIYVAGEAAATIAGEAAVADIAGGGGGAHKTAFDGAVGLTCAGCGVEGVELFTNNTSIVFAAAGTLY